MDRFQQRSRYKNTNSNSKVVRRTPTRRYIRSNNFNQDCVTIIITIIIIIIIIITVVVVVVVPGFVPRYFSLACAKLSATVLRGMLRMRSGLDESVDFSKLCEPGVRGNCSVFGV